MSKVYELCSNSRTIPSGFTFLRNSQAYAIENGLLVVFPPNVPVWTDHGLRIDSEVLPGVNNPKIGNLSELSGASNFNFPYAYNIDRTVNVQHDNKGLVEKALRTKVWEPSGLAPNFIDSIVEVFDLGVKVSIGVVTSIENWAFKATWEYGKDPVIEAGKGSTYIEPLGEGPNHGQLYRFWAVTDRDLAYGQKVAIAPTGSFRNNMKVVVHYFNVSNSWTKAGPAYGIIDATKLYRSFTPVAELTYMIEAKAASSWGSTQTLWQLDDGTENKKVCVERRGNGDLVFHVFNSGTMLDLVLGNVQNNMVMKLAFKIDGNNVKASLNGIEILSGTFTWPTGLTTERIGCSSVKGFEWSGSIKKIVAYNELWTDNQLRVNSQNALYYSQPQNLNFVPSNVFTLDVSKNSPDGYISIPKYLRNNAVRPSFGGSRTEFVYAGDNKLTLVPTLQGEIPVAGARREWELLRYNNDFSNPVWTKYTGITYTYPEPGVIRIVPNSPGLNQTWLAQEVGYTKEDLEGKVRTIALDIRLVQPETGKRITIEHGVKKADGSGYISSGGSVPLTTEWTRVQVPSSTILRDYARISMTINTSWDITSEQVPQYGIEIRRPSLRLLYTNPENNVIQEWFDSEVDYGFGVKGVRYYATKSGYTWDSNSNSRKVTETPSTEPIPNIIGLRPQPLVTSSFTNDLSCRTNNYCYNLTVADSSQDVISGGFLFVKHLPANNNEYKYKLISVSNPTTVLHIQAIVLKNNTALPMLEAHRSDASTKHLVNQEWTNITKVGEYGQGFSGISKLTRLNTDVYLLELTVYSTSPALMNGSIIVCNLNGQIAYNTTNEHLHIACFNAFTSEYGGTPMLGSGSILSRSADMFPLPSNIYPGLQYYVGSEYNIVNHPPYNVTDPALSFTGPNVNLLHTNSDGFIEVDHKNASEGFTTTLGRHRTIVIKKNNKKVDVYNDGQLVMADRPTDEPMSYFDTIGGRQDSWKGNVGILRSEISPYSGYKAFQSTLYSVLQAPDLDLALAGPEARIEDIAALNVTSPTGFNYNTNEGPVVMSYSPWLYSGKPAGMPGGLKGYRVVRSDRPHNILNEFWTVYDVQFFTSIVPNSGPNNESSWRIYSTNPLNYAGLTYHHSTYGYGQGSKHVEFSVWLKSNNGQNQTLTLTTDHTTYKTITVTPEWKLFSIVGRKAGGGISPAIMFGPAHGCSPHVDFLVTGAQFFPVDWNETKASTPVGQWEGRSGLQQDPFTGEKYIAYPDSTCLFLTRPGYTVNSDNTVTPGIGEKLTNTKFMGALPSATSVAKDSHGYRLWKESFSSSWNYQPVHGMFYRGGARIINLGTGYSNQQYNVNPTHTTQNLYHEAIVEKGTAASVYISIRNSSISADTVQLILDFDTETILGVGTTGVNRWANKLSNTGPNEAKTFQLKLYEANVTANQQWQANQYATYTTNTFNTIFHHTEVRRGVSTFRGNEPFLDAYIRTHQTYFTNYSYTRLAETITTPRLIQSGSRTCLVDIELEVMPNLDATILYHPDGFKIEVLTNGKVRVTDGTTTLTSVAALTTGTHKIGFSTGVGSTFLRIGNTFESFTQLMNLNYLDRFYFGYLPWGSINKVKSWARSMTFAEFQGAS